MSDFYPDPCLALATRAADAAIGRDINGIVSKTAFIQRLAAWHALIDTLPGQQLALYLDDSLEFAAALLAAWQAKKTVWLTADTLPATCLALSTSVSGFLGDFPAEHAPLVAGTAAGNVDALLDFAPLDPDFIGLVVHTSGSTGQPQAIPKKISQLISEVRSLEQTFSARLADAEVIATVSHQHIYGLLFKVLWPLSAGRLIHARSLNFPEQLHALLLQHACVLIGSPAHLKRLPEHLDWAACRANVRAIFSSGGPLTAETAFAIGSMLGQVPVEVYGSSETGGIAWRQRQHGYPEVWDALPDVNMRIAGKDGVLEVQSPHLPDASWLQMADRAQLTGDGRLMLLGRSDRIVKIEEKRISLDAMEQSLLATGLVSEARVIADDGAGGQRQRLSAFIVLTEQGRIHLDAEGKSACNQRLRTHLSKVVEAVALPRRWRYLDQMPVNSQGKTTHAQLLALLDKEQEEARPRLPQQRLLEQTATRILFELVVPASLFYFDGHFDVAPILPGVVQVDWAIRFAREHFALPPVFSAIHALKFQHVINAEAPVMLELVHDVAKGSLQFRYFSDAGQHAGGRILFVHEKPTC
ncbi:AMP-binding protein [Undibacterium sp. TS12]|uniref:AMP-binding protein n=1 Tax=Undibacterium sp. TS12 TaxID=2908202 RepID=UPI001F4CF4C1|nr:AMP-binding protein [Undibacterium sp. TS12]MCH8620677.1 AMP-binding protein [Undibacterium sp. TS12]